MRFTNIDVNKRANLFNKTIKNIILNYIPHETAACDDRDPPFVKMKTTYSQFIISNFFSQS